MRNALIERKTALNKVNMPVSYLTEEDFSQLTQGCKRERDQLLIMALYQTGLRISEALALTPVSIRNFAGRPAMTLRYLSTLTQEDALKVQQEVEFDG